MIPLGSQVEKFWRDGQTGATMGAVDVETVASKNFFHVDRGTT